MKEFIEYLIRVKKGKLSCDEMIEIENRLKDGKKVSKRKLKLYNKQMESISEALKNIKMPDFKNMVHIPTQIFPPK